MRDSQFGDELVAIVETAVHDHQRRTARRGDRVNLSDLLGRHPETVMDQAERAVDVLLGSIRATMPKRLAHSAQDVPIDRSAIQIPHARDAAHGSEYTGRAAPARPRMTLAESATLCADPDVLATTFGNEVVLLNLRDGI